MHIKQAVIEVRRLSGDTAVIETRPTGRTVFSEGDISGVLRFAQEGPGLVGTLDMDIRQRVCNATDNLALEAPVTLRLYPHQLPEDITALYIYDDWWTRPAFCKSYAEVPKRTQAAFLRYKDHYACLVPMVGRRFKTVMCPGGEDHLAFQLTAGRDGQAGVHEPLFAYAEAPSAREAVKRVFSFLIRERSIRPRTARPFPEIFEYLGWCSWDAFYKDLTEEGVRAKAAELQEKDVPIRWAVLDDGWLSVKDDMLWDFVPDPKKFPRGFSRLAEDLKTAGPFRSFGVWHAVSGYWGGIHPAGPLAKTQKGRLLFADNGRVLPAPDAERSCLFYMDWHQLLHDEGIDFVKVDVQNSIANHFRTQTSLCEASKALQLGLEAGTACMENTIINCMGMAMENMLSRPTSAVSRNSDDFFPDRQDSFREHLLQNAYNAYYHGEIYWCDWDMFWTSHPDAQKHALFRAVSGGPVYCSDRVGETDPEILRPLAYLDGRLLRLQGAARVTEDCLFRNPLQEGVLKVANTGSTAGTAGGCIAGCNLTGQPQICTYSPADIDGLPAAETYLLYDWYDKTVRTAALHDTLEKEIGADSCIFVIVLPCRNTAVWLGRTDKYTGFTAVEAVKETADGCMCILKEQGPAAVYTDREIAACRLNGADATDTLTSGGTGLHFLNLPQAPEKAVLQLQYA